MLSGNPKSHSEENLGLAKENLADLETALLSVRASSIHGVLRAIDPGWISASIRRDTNRLERRYQMEGLEFLTKTLPRLGKYLDQGLELGVLPARPEGFAPYDETGRPLFLAALWYVVGFYLDNYPFEAKEDRSPYLPPGESELLRRVIKTARSVLYAFYKLNVPFKPEDEEKAQANFIATDDECGVNWSRKTHDDIETASLLIKDVLEGFDPLDIVPGHGPGAVATGEKQEQKWEFSHLYSGLHQVYPYYEYMYGIRENGSAGYPLADMCKKYMRMVRSDEPTSKVVFVPKDSRGPRTICAEPLEIQYIQQGVMRTLVPKIERHPLTRGHVNFRDQGVNQVLAKSASLTRDFATLDLKDASDRVSLELFQAIWPIELQRAFLACRSTHAKLPSGSVVKLRKFAPMGSALCFPVEALIFWALCVASLVNQGTSVSVARRLVYVYGDDLVVPVGDVESVVRTLEGAGLAVNLSKCCHRGYFRESCGVDAFYGLDVTPVRIRKASGRRPSDGLAHRSWAAYASQYGTSGMMRSSMYARNVVERVLGRIPITTTPADYLSFVIPSEAWCLSDYHVVRWNASICSPESKLWVLRDTQRPWLSGPWERLLRGLVAPVEESDPSKVVVPRATKMVKKWIPLRGITA